jgi:dTDP-4-dehydrorhamnose reductase
MTVPSILVTGGTGLLGLNCGATLRETHCITLGVHQRTVNLQGVRFKEFPLDSVDSILRVLDDVQPDYVIHAAGLTSVEVCEEKPDLAHHVNVVLAENVAIACARRGVKLVHISTDHLFSGDDQFASEDERVKPINSYARTKAEAEKRVGNSCPDALIIRTNFFGWGTTYRQSFTDKIIETLTKGQALQLFDDIFYTPILMESMVEIIQKLLLNQAHGIFNVVGSERITKYDFGIKVARKFSLDEELIVRCSIAEFTRLISRPSDMSLCNKKICNFLNLKQCDVDHDLQKLLSQKKNGLANELQRL